MVQRSEGFGGCNNFNNRLKNHPLRTYDFYVIRFGPQDFDLVERDDFHAAVLCSLSGSWSDVSEDDEFAQASRCPFQKEVAFGVVFTNDDRDFSLEGKTELGTRG